MNPDLGKPHRLPTQREPKKQLTFLFATHPCFNQSPFHLPVFRPKPFSPSGSRNDQLRVQNTPPFIEGSDSAPSWRWLWTTRRSRSTPSLKCRCRGASGFSIWVLFRLANQTQNRDFGGSPPHFLQKSSWFGLNLIACQQE